MIDLSATAATTANRRPLGLGGGVVALLLTGCLSTTPTHYYSLLGPPASARSASPTTPGNAPGVTPLLIPIEVLPVGIPAQVDQPQLLVRAGAGRLQPLEQERWVAPLADELRGALAENLSNQLGVPDVAGQPQAPGAHVLRVKVDVRRFDSAPADYAAIAAVWSLSMSVGHTAALICTSDLRETAGGGYDELVHAHQRALARLAVAIAAAARNYVADNKGVCPDL